MARFFLILNGEYNGALPMLDPRSFRAQICWTSPKSLGDLICTSPKWRKRQHRPTWPCTCSHLDASWPRGRCPVTGGLHVCAGQEEIPWPARFAWISSWSARTRIRPSVAQVRTRTASALLDLARRRGLESTAAVISAANSCANDIAHAAGRAWRVSDITRESIYDADEVQAAAEFVGGLWVAVRDHATHRFQAICPALALTAIHKVWEYDVHHPGDHFRYGSFISFGFRDLEDVLDNIAHPPGLPDELLPVSLAKRRRKEWDLGRCCTLPKNADPAGSRRPLCNRVSYPSAELDSLLCRAGVWALGQLDVSEHLDVDKPLSVADAFKR